jgi:hypothetical protein
MIDHGCYSDEYYSLHPTLSTDTPTNHDPFSATMSYCQTFAVFAAVLKQGLRYPVALWCAEVRDSDVAISEPGVSYVETRHNNNACLRLASTIKKSQPFFTTPSKHLKN